MRLSVLFFQGCCVAGRGVAGGGGGMGEFPPPEMARRKNFLEGYPLLLFSEIIEMGKNLQV
ncbi:MAG: hypothetical protein GY820_18335 [Gammaproteobacteria bacterium]|nr:hypothetical protein [Gammaproteobacteria bacterium]